MSAAAKKMLRTSELEVQKLQGRLAEQTEKYDVLDKKRKKVGEEL